MTKLAFSEQSWQQYGELTGVRRELGRTITKEIVTIFQTKDAKCCNWISRGEIEFKSTQSRGSTQHKDVFMGQETEICESNESLYLEK